MHFQLCWNCLSLLLTFMAFARITAAALLLHSGTGMFFSPSAHKELQLPQWLRSSFAKLPASLEL